MALLRQCLWELRMRMKELNDSTDWRLNDLNETGVLDARLDNVHPLSKALPSGRPLQADFSEVCAVEA